MKTEPPEDLRAALTQVIWDAYEVGYENGQESREPLHEEAKVDTILHLCEAAALAALPEEKHYGDTCTPMRCFCMYTPRNDAIATAQANFHSVFGGSK